MENVKEAPAWPRAFSRPSNKLNLSYLQASAKSETRLGFM
ncbi:MAG: hypothetical protein OP8BY_1304 [Candidatus Saccharicenans subterraneus]|uniref:Uncharacterized protein n=1 Tax=Candidatus Saccharicenans subterraneus TaxID=2508984 RepID=A0A3E2BPR0_9BACT|nr:MAG: hypothetical protein OP8BY_1304 [Candidatus Saccharicenans subterraneum]